MRLKQKVALLLSGVMLTGLVVVVNPVDVKATPTSNEFTLTVPADVNITSSGWNSIGDVKVTGTVESASKVIVSIATANGSKLKSGSNEVPYTIKKKEIDSFATTSIDFDAAAVNGGTATQAIGADVSGFSDKPSGTYEDTINFTAKLVVPTPPVVEYELTGSNAGRKKLTSTDLLATTNKSTFISSGKKYIAYNGFIEKTAYANWQDAQNFITELNKVELDGRTGGWELLSTPDIAFDWWQSTADAGQKHPRTNVKYGQISFGGVDSVWFSTDNGGVGGDYWACNSARFLAEIGEIAVNIKADAGAGGAWSLLEKGRSLSLSGFVVLRVANN